MKPYLKWTAISIGGVIAIAHVGVLGHLISKDSVVGPPTINIPNGTPYSSYKIEADKEGYKIEYKANDPAILESQKSLSLDKKKKGIFGFGAGDERRREWRRDQYTMHGTRNLGGVADGGEGKNAKDVECIVADAGARSQGAMAGSAIAAGVGVPAAMSIPYVGWLAAGWTALIGQQVGETVGSTVGGIFNDC